MNKQIFNHTVLAIFLAFSYLYAPPSRTAGSTIEASGLEKPIVSEEYILMPGDTILITITGATNYSYRTGITYEGKVAIRIPVASRPTAQGVFVPQYDIVSAVPIYSLTLENAKDSLTNVFLRYFRNIDVDITLLGMRTFVVFVAGEVRNPGRAFARPIDRVSTVIAAAGKINAIGSRSQIELRRDGRLVKLVDLEEFERTGNIEVNPFVQDGDLIYVPRMKKSFIAIGAIFGKAEYETTEPAPSTEAGKPASSVEKTSEGRYELIEGETVSDIVAKVDITPWADLASAYIERNGKKISIDLSNVFADENSQGNIEIENGDVLHIPSISAAVYVQGQVVNPGSFVFQPNLKASDYIGLAGGPQSDASMSAAYVQRDKDKIPVKKNPVIETGDKIMVPRQTFKFWQDYLEIGAVLASLLISYLTLTAD